MTALAPFAVFHDLRWLLVYSSSWPTFALELMLVLSARALLDTFLTRAAWPAHAALPPWREQCLAAARFTAGTALMLLPFAVLLFAMAVTSLSWLFFVAVPVLLLITVLVHHGAVDPRWWWDAPSAASVGAVFLAFASLTVAGGVVGLVPPVAAVVVAGLAGVANAWCRLRLTHALAGRVAPDRRRPFVLVGLAGVVALVVGGTAAGFAVAVAVEAARSPLPEARRSTGPPVLVVKGFNSTWDGVTRQWVDGDFRIRRFSYRGLDDSGRPEIYERDDTHRSLRALVLEMREQVDVLYESTGRRVSIVAESEGALVAQAYLAGTPDAPVQAVALLSPLLEPGRVYYPPPGDAGWGVVAGTVVDGLAAVVGAVGPVDVSSNTPLFRSLLREAPVLRSLLRCPPPVASSIVVLPLDSGVAAPPPLDVRWPHAVVPAFHGGLLGDGTTSDLVGHVLRGEPATGSGLWAGVGDVVNGGAAAWQVPSIEQDLVGAWATLPADDACVAARGELRRWLAAR